MGIPFYPHSLTPLQHEFVTETRGTGMIVTSFHAYAPYKGAVQTARRGALISMVTVRKLDCLHFLIDLSPLSSSLLFSPLPFRFRCCLYSLLSSSLSLSAARLLTSPLLSPSLSLSSLLCWVSTHLSSAFSSFSPLSSLLSSVSTHLSCPLSLALSRLSPVLGLSAHLIRRARRLRTRWISCSRAELCSWALSSMCTAE